MGESLSVGDSRTNAPACSQGWRSAGVWQYPQREQRHIDITTRVRMPAKAHVDCRVWCLLRGGQMLHSDTVSAGTGSMTINRQAARMCQQEAADSSHPCIA